MHTQKKIISFGSDNHTGIHPQALAAIQAANHDMVSSYGGDDYTKQAIERMRAEFGDDTEIFFLTTGTAANVTSLQAIMQSYQAVIAADSAHIHTDECGAFEHYVGGKILTFPAPHGKLEPHVIEHFLSLRGSVHHSQPAVVSLTQSTEYGTVYSVEELRSICTLAHSHNLLVHMDGNRLFNAAAYLGVSLKELTKEVGVDVLALGGTKNGLFCAEAVLFFDPKLAKHFPYIRKQAMQLVSKMRFISVQYSALFSNNVWLHNAQHANAMAQLLAQELAMIPEIKITQKVQANAIFAILPPELIAKLQKDFFFYVWNQASSEIRLMTSWATKPEEVYTFGQSLRKLL